MMKLERLKLGLLDGWSDMEKGEQSMQSISPPFPIIKAKLTWMYENGVLVETKMTKDFLGWEEVMMRLSKR